MEPFRFAWWNTNLSPGGQQRDQTERRRALAQQVVRALIDDVGVCVLSLGEVSEEEARQLTDACTTSLYPLPIQLSGMVIIVRDDWSEWWDCEVMTTVCKGNSLTRCMHLLFSHSDTFGDLHMFVLHWPSDAYGNAGANYRDRLAQDMRDTMRSLSQVIVIGDFNGTCSGGAKNLRDF